VYRKPKPGRSGDEVRQGFKGDADKAKTPYQGLQPMSADDVAETIFWACMLPRHININRMQMMPVMYGFSSFAFARK
jgi:3-hydroxy acid dehydrogenase/malonic semialdehyde reductase